MSTQTVVSGKSFGQPFRLHALDAARAIAMLLGVFFHSLESFVTYMPDHAYPIKDVARHPILDVIHYSLHTFRMQAFFLIGGYFAHQLYTRQGAFAFVKQRVNRLAIPLFVFWPVSYYLLRVAWLKGHTPLKPATERYSTWLTAGRELVRFTWFRWQGLIMPLYHLWFLYYLLLFSGGAVMAQWIVVHLVDRSGSLRQWIGRGLPYLLTTGWAGLGVGLLIGLAMCRMTQLFGVDTPNQNLVVNTRPFLVYWLFFGFGWLLHRKGHFIDQLKHYRFFNLIISLILIYFLSTYFLAHAYPTPDNGNLTPETRVAQLIYQFTYGVASSVGVFAFIEYMTALFSRFNQRLRYLADASYWLYVAHLPLVVFMQYWVSAWRWPASVKVVFVVGSSLTVLLLVYQYCIRGSRMGGLLNGRRHPPSYPSGGQRTNPKATQPLY